jgi:diadenosine tetraphosphate (Ap4A) HIT family hydrolase
MAKYRSIDPEYVPQIIKEYTHWTLSIHENQYYLGRCYIWRVSEGGMQRLSEITPEELLELQEVLKEFEVALKKLWQPDHMNYAWLGNLFHQHGGHGHMHVIPRYKASRTFEGRVYTDERWGKNYSPTPSHDLDEATLFRIRDAIKEAIAQ